MKGNEKMTLLDFLQQDERELLDSTSTFEELLAIAIIVLSRMPKPIVYLCGPITTGGKGSEKENILFFQSAANLLHSQGHYVFDMISLHPAIVRIMQSRYPAGEYCMDILEVLCAGIFQSGFVSYAFCLPGWESSTGARWERERLPFHNIPIHDFPDHWIEQL